MFSLRYCNILNLVKKTVFPRRNFGFRISDCNTLDVSEGIMESCELKNGMRVVCEYNGSFTTAIGCFLPAGAMYEKPEERGSSLFLEHLLFRRTVKRNQREIEIEITEIGGKLAASAMRDAFVLYGVVPSCNVDRFIKILADILLNGITCDEDVACEKSIILHELAKLESDYEKVVMDYLPSIAYQDTELEKSVYPESRVIKNFCAEALTNFKCRVVKPCFMTLVSTGGTPFCEIQKAVCEYFNEEETDCRSLETCESDCSIEAQQYRFSGADLRLRDDDEELGFVAIGVEGPAYSQCEDHCVFSVAKRIVGSWDMSYGGGNHNAPYLAHRAFNSNLCYMYKSFFLDWRCTSIWGCYFVCDKLKLEDMVYLLQEEWMKLCTIITQKEVQRAVNQCRTIELMKLNDPVDRFFDIFNCLFRRGYYDPLNERLAKYENITAEMVRETANRYLYDQSPSVVALGRIEQLPDYNNIRSHMYLLRY